MGGSWHYFSCSDLQDAESILVFFNSLALLISSQNLDSSLKFPGLCWRLPLAQEELTYMQMKQRNPAASDPERKEEDQDYTHVHRALEKTPSTPSMFKLHN